MAWGFAILGSALAAPSPSRAVVIGSDLAGPGQEPLRWAEADARAVEQVLVDLGGFAPSDVEVLLDPDPKRILDAIDRAAADLAVVDDRPTRFVLYYSGHARSHTLTLGADDLPIAELDARIQQVPAQQRLAVLDACQSGEPGGPKGIAAEAAFSFVSVAGLATAGTAVVASSTADELSQESERLGGSTFTHHWLTGLRGAADVDHDGVVTLDEAYAYAYHRTVVDTATTAIGAEHPTLRVDRTGHGDWILAHPSPESAAMELPADLEGAVTVVEQGSGHVVAEVAKQPPDAVRLALPPGRYEVLVVEGSAGSSCDLTVAAGQISTLDPARCAPAPRASGRDKGPPREPVDLSSQLSLTARVGGALYASLASMSAGLEVGFRPIRSLEVVVGADVFDTKRVMSPRTALETGLYSNWYPMFPLNAGLVYAPWTGAFQPYVGADLITVQYYEALDRTWFATGARVRIGFDRMVSRSVGFQANGAFGAWSGSRWHVEGIADSGVLSQLTAGVVLAR